MARSLSADRHAPAALPGQDCGCFGAQVHAEKVSVATQPQTSPEAHLLVSEGAGSEFSDCFISNTVRGTRVAGGERDFREEEKHADAAFSQRGGFKKTNKSDGTVENTSYF